MLASSPGHSQILSRSRGEKSGEGLVPILVTVAIRHVGSIGCILRGHVAIIMKSSPHYVRIKSTISGP